MVAEKGNVLAERKIGEYSGRLQRASQSNVLPRDGGKKFQWSNPNVSVSKNTTSVLKPLMQVAIPTWKPKKTLLMKKQVDPTGCAGPVKPNLGAGECRQLRQEPQPDSKSTKNPQCATLAAQIAMGQKCTPDKRSYANVIGGASSEATHVDRPISSDAVSGQTDQEMTGGIQLQQSDRSQNQKPAKTNVQEKLPSLLTLKIRAVKGNLQSAGRKTGEHSARRPGQSRKNVLPQNGGKESQCSNPNVNVSENLTNSAKQLNHLHFPRGKPAKTLHNPKQSKPMDCAGPVKPNPRASKIQQDKQIPHPDSKSIDSQKPPCATLAADLAVDQTCKPTDCAGPVKPNLGADECRELIQKPHSDSKSPKSKMPQCATLAADLEMGQKCTPDKRSYAEVISGASLEATHVDQPMSSDSSDAVSGQTDQEMTGGIQLQQSDKSQNQKPAKTNVHEKIPSLLTLKVRAVKGNLQSAGRKTGEHSARRPRQSRKNVLPQGGGKESQCSNSNVNVSENLTRAVKQLNHLHFPRGKPAKTLHNQKQSKPMDCAGPVKPNPSASKIQQEKQIPHPDSKSTDSQKPPCATLAADLAMGQNCKPTDCAGPVKPNLGADECRELIQEPHSDSKSTNSKMPHCATLAADLAMGQKCKPTGCADPINPNLGADECRELIQELHSDSKSTNSKMPHCATLAADLAMDQKCKPTGCADPVKPNLGADECRELIQELHSDSKSTNSKMPQCATPAADLAMDQICTFGTRSYADVLTGASSKPTHVDRPISSDSVSGQTDQEMTGGIQLQQRYWPHDHKPAKTKMQMFLENPPFLSWSPLVNTNIRHNTDTVNWQCEQHFGHSSLDSDDEGYPVTPPDHMASDSDNDPMGQGMRSSGRPSPDTYDPMSLGYSCPQLQFMESEVSNYWQCECHRCGTRNEGSQLLQLDHLLQVPDIEDPWSCFQDPWSCFQNNLSPCESLTYEQYCDITAFFAREQLTQTAADMYTPYDQTAALVATSEYHSAASTTVYQVQTATTSSDSAAGWPQFSLQTDLEAAESQVMRDDYAVLVAMGACLYQDDQSAAASATVSQVQTATTSRDSAAGWPQPSPLTDLEAAEAGVMRDDYAILAAMASCL